MSAAPLLDRLERVYGLGPEPGANRLGLSAEEQQAHELASRWFREAGLEVTVDAAGNLFGRLRGVRPDLPEVWTGSHLDSVPRGGRFDGPLGVLAGLEAISRIGRQERTLAVVAFRDEEGVRFGRGCFGSRALCGALADDELEAPDAEGVTVAAALKALGLEPPPAAGWLERPPSVFFEIHVEQAALLERLNAPLGVVTAIAGLARMAVTVRGAAGHAGTTAMPDRNDALVSAARFVLRVREAALAYEGAVATVGRLGVEPGSPNVIPALVTLTVDARAPDGGELESLLAEICTAAAGAEVEFLRRTSPVPMAPAAVDALRRALQGLRVPVVELHSGAGHDAGVLAAAGVPAGMLFVRSRAGGVSHSPEEWSDPEDLELAVEALARALRELAA